LILSSCILGDLLEVLDYRVFKIDKDYFEFTVKRDEEFNVSVKGNPSTGYSWYLTVN